MPPSRCSPRPSSTGEMARCSSSTSRARRYSRMVATPPPRRTSLSPAAAFASSSASSIPVVTKRNSVPPSHGQRLAGVMRSARRPARGTAAPRPTSRATARRARDPGWARTCSGPGSRPQAARSPGRRSRRPCPSRRRARRARLRHVRVVRNQSCNSSPPTPNGWSRSWSGPAPKPSIEIENARTMSLGIAPPFVVASVGGALLLPMPAPGDSSSAARSRIPEGNRVQPSGQTAGRVEAPASAGARCGQRTRAAAGSAAALSDNPPRSEAAS